LSEAATLVAGSDGLSAASRSSLEWMSLAIGDTFLTIEFESMIAIAELSWLMSSLVVANS